MRIIEQDGDEPFPGGGPDDSVVEEGADWTEGTRAILPFVVVGALFGVFTLWLEKFKKGASGQEFALSFLDRFLVAGRSFWFCLGKLVWPARLTFFYPHWQIDTADAWSYLFPLGAIALLATTWWARRWVGRAPLAALVYFSLAFPALVMVQVLYMMRYSFVSDHWQYLGSMSVIPLGVGGVVATLDRWKSGHSWIRTVIGVFVLAGLGWLTWRQGHIYQNAETLWRDTEAKNPNAWIAYHNLGAILGQAGKVEDAIVQFEQALRIRPDLYLTYNSLGTAFHKEGKIQNAIECYERGLRIKPDFDQPHYNLRVALLQTGKIEGAITQFEQALRISPDYVSAHASLAAALIQAGRVQDAISHYEQALRIKPNWVEVHCDLAAVLLKTGKLQDAISHYEQALRIKPDHVSAQNNLAWLLATLSLAEGGDPVRAVTLAQQACEQTGNRVVAYVDTLAVAYAAAGRFNDAIAAAQKTIELARSTGNQSLVKEMEARLEQYRAHQSVGVASPLAL